MPLIFKSTPPCGTSTNCYAENLPVYEPSSWSQQAAPVVAVPVSM